MNFFLNIIMQAAPEVADTLHKSAFREFLQTIKGMTGEQIIDMAIRGTLDAIVRIAIACVIFYVGRWIVRRLTTVIHKIFIKRDVEASLATFLLSLVNITMTFILIIIVISFLGIDTTSFIAIFASAGLAVGMALSGTLQTGTVKAITLFSTVLATPDNKNIILPNGGMSTGIINNYSKENIRRVDWTFGIAYGDDYDKAKATIASLLEADDRVMKDPAYFIALGALADSSVNITVRAWVASEDYWGVFFDMNEKVYKTFPKEGLNIPFPQMDVHLDKN